MVKRVSLILGQADEAVIADVLRALLRAGADALNEQALDVGYAQLASDFNDLSADAERRGAPGPPMRTGSKTAMRADRNRQTRGLTESPRTAQYVTVTN